MRAVAGETVAFQLPVKQWPNDFGAAVSSVEVVTRNLVAGDDTQETVHKLQLWDKPKALELFFRPADILAALETDFGQPEVSGGDRIVV